MTAELPDMKAWGENEVNRVWKALDLLYGDPAKSCEIIMLAVASHKTPEVMMGRIDEINRKRDEQAAAEVHNVQV